MRRFPPHFRTAGYAVLLLTSVTALMPMLARAQSVSARKPPIRIDVTLPAARRLSLDCRYGK